ncbi:hypothetical protein [Cohnella herbarum]|uniref:Uncharacterized protein n=1 Tax=Cohnella herbarum TaxID=2728023 RepID=A0A7Z2VR00_9BACL|nr:hypothetical protein [Cohnella herbarum]QJD87598.1 hypothetical protein HH215_33400 [Cohnella herbarum]
MKHTFQQAITEFNSANTVINSRVAALNSEIRKKKSEHVQATERYKQAMIEDAAGTKEYTTTELSELKQKAENIALDISTATERLEMLTSGANSGKKEKLRILLDDVKTAWKHEVDGINDDIDKVQSEARELRALLTLKIAEANVFYKKAQQVKQELNAVEHSAGLSYQERTSKSGVPDGPKLKQIIGSSYPVLAVGDECIVPREDELENAYLTGGLPLWIQHYANTGELVTDKEARSLLEKISKTENKQKGKSILSRLFPNKT